MFMTKEQMRKYWMNKMLEGLACAAFIMASIFAFAYMLTM